MFWLFLGSIVGISNNHWMWDRCNPFVIIITDTMGLRALDHLHLKGCMSVDALSIALISILMICGKDSIALVRPCTFFSVVFVKPMRNSQMHPCQEEAMLWNKFPYDSLSIQSLYLQC